MEANCLLLKGRLERGEGIGDMTHYFLCCVRSVKTEHHGIGNVFSPSSELLKQHLQPLSVPERCLQKSHVRSV